MIDDEEAMKSFFFAWTKLRMQEKKVGLCFLRSVCL